MSLPPMDKVHVKAPEPHSLYSALTVKHAKFPGDIEWNFGRFLFGRNGEGIKRSSPRTKRDDAKVVAAMEAALKAK